MNTDAFRHLYDYHFTTNRKIWEQGVLALPDRKFVKPVAYSVGSVRNHVIHMINIDDRWFSGLRGEEIPDFADPTPYTDRALIRQLWDDVEGKMREYLMQLDDAALYTQPFLALDGDPIYLWQALLHVVNHGTDHRAQLLALLTAFGVETFPQDYADYVEGRM